MLRASICGGRVRVKTPLASSVAISTMLPVAAL